MINRYGHRGDGICCRHGNPAGAKRLGRASSATADNLKMNGIYQYADEDGDTGTWTIDTTCRQVCVAHVWTAPGQGFNAPLIDGQYTVTRTIPEAAICSNDLSQHPVTVNQSWDPLTLTGVAIFFDSSAPCGLSDPHDTFTLTKIG